MPVRLAWEHVALPATVARRFRPDVVFTPFNVAPTWWPTPRPEVAVIVSNLAPYSSEVRAMYRGRERLRLEALRRLTDRTLAAAARVFLLSEQAVDLIDDRLLAGKSEVIPMAPPATGSPAVGSLRTPPGPFFLVATDLLRFKGVELVLEALALTPAGERAQVLVVGRPLDAPYVRFLRRTARRLQVEGSLRLAGAVQHDRVLALMRESAACIVPSRFENASRVPVEAMSLGVPVIVSDIPAFRETCADAALHFDLEDPSQLAEQMRSATSDGSFRQKWGTRGQRRLAALDTGSASERILASIEGITAGSR